MRAVVAWGLLELQPGSGTVVRAQPFASTAESMVLLVNLGVSSGRLDHTKVVEVRRVLEVEIAGLAAVRASGAGLVELAAIIGRARAGLDDLDTFVATDIACHAALARATQNELFSVILALVSDVMVEVRRLGSRVRGVPAGALANHRALLGRVRHRDAPGAHDAIDHHLDDAFGHPTARPHRR